MKTFGMMISIITTNRRMTFIIMTLGVMAFGIMAFRIMTQ